MSMNAEQLRREVEAQKQHNKTAAGCLKALGTFITVASIVWWRPFIVMIVLGIVHDLWPVVPALGFWATWAVIIAWGIVTGRQDVTKAVSDAVSKKKPAA